jgi:hypothetical protein
LQTVPGFSIGLQLSALDHRLIGKRDRLQIPPQKMKVQALLGVYVSLLRHKRKT